MLNYCARPILIVMCTIWHIKRFEDVFGAVPHQSKQPQTRERTSQIGEEYKYVTQFGSFFSF